MTRLSEGQRERLRDMMRDMVAPIIQESMQVQLASLANPNTDYLRLIHGGRSQNTRFGKSDMPEALRTFARLGMSMAIAKGDSGAGLEAARTLGIESEFTKSLSAGSAEGGGLLLTDDQALEVIEFLRPVSVMRRIGARPVIIPRGTKRTPRIDVGATSGYVGEGQAIPATDIKSGSVVLTAKKLATLVVLTNELLQFSNQPGDLDVDSIVADEMLSSMGTTEDTKFLFGSGSESEPTGIVNQAPESHKFDANGTVNVDNTVADLAKAITTMRRAKVKMVRPAWILSGRTEVFLQTLLNTDGNFVFRSEIENGRLLRFPFFTTENVPDDEGAGSDESKIILVDAQEVMLGDVQQVSIDRSGDATVNIDGENVNLFQTDRSAIRTRTWNDIRMRHPEGIVVISAVTWGA